MFVEPFIGILHVALGKRLFPALSYLLFARRFQVQYTPPYVYSIELHLFTDFFIILFLASIVLYLYEYMAQLNPFPQRLKYVPGIQYTIHGHRMDRGDC